MAVQTRRMVYYTFGNHKHWVDMVWNWGEFVLPASVRDMLSLMEQTGAKGNVNFDVVGYEQLAITDPEAFDALKQAIHDGRAEMVGASYGQPYGLFCGGEANVRQLVMGVLVCEKLFGVCAPSPGGKRSSTSSRSYRKSCADAGSSTAVSSSSGPGTRHTSPLKRSLARGGAGWTAPRYWSIPRPTPACTSGPRTLNRACATKRWNRWSTL